MSAIQVISTNTDLMQINQYTKEQIELIKRTICKGASDDELAMFMQLCNKTGLDPFSRQIWSVERRSYTDEGKWEVTRSTQVSIDGLRLIADRTGKYQGQTCPMWCGDDGKWVDVWLKNEPPKAAKIGTYKKGFKEPIYAIALYSSYVQKKKNGDPTRFWKTMPDVMLAKCAEAMSLRKGFPQELSGIYSNDEMGQADSDYVEEKQANKNTTQLTHDPAQIKKLTDTDKEGFLNMIYNSEDLEELKSTFVYINRMIKTIDPKFLEEIVKAKDEKKAEIIEKESNDYFGDEKSDEHIQS